MKPIAVVLLLLWFQVMQQSSAMIAGITRGGKKSCSKLFSRLGLASRKDGSSRSIDTSSAPVAATVPTTSTNQSIEEIHPDVNEDVSRLREEDQLNNPLSGSPPPHLSPDQGAHSSATGKEYIDDDQALAVAMAVSTGQMPGHPGASSVDGPNPVSIPEASLNEEPGASHDVNPSPLHSQNERNPPLSGMPTPQPPASRSAPVAATVPTTSANEDVSRLRADDQLNNPSSGSPPPHPSPDQGAHSSAFAREEYPDDLEVLLTALVTSMAEMPDPPGTSSVDGPAYNGELDEEMALSIALASSVPGMPDHPGASSVDRPNPISIPKASLKEEPGASRDVNPSPLHSPNERNPPLSGMPTPHLSPPQPPESRSAPVAATVPTTSIIEPIEETHPDVNVSRLRAGDQLNNPSSGSPPPPDQGAHSSAFARNEYFDEPGALAAAMAASLAQKPGHPGASSVDGPNPVRIPNASLRQSSQNHGSRSYPTGPNRGIQVAENSSLSITWVHHAIIGYFIFVLYLKGYICNCE